MPDKITLIVERFRSMLAGDGADIEVSSVAGGVLELQYRSAPESECESCVLMPEDLESLMLDALASAGTGITEVRVVHAST